jgi:UDP-N-acetylglucosamine--N-acetylmuramyl-(pentapeptide) pyrophosphoryl-undecaprenol N-acetylglucosamine transferase
MKNATVVAKGWRGEEEAQKDGRILEVYTGIPVAAEFQPVSEAQQRKLKESFGFNPDEPLLVVTGGSQGARDINEAVRVILPQLLDITGVGLVAGRKYYEEVVDLKKYEDWEKAKLKSNFRMWEFNSAMHELLGAADVVISRAGATTIAELAALEKAVILVPYERLPGGHQMKNARDLGKSEAVLVVENERMVARPVRLLEKVESLVKSKRERQKLARNLHEQAVPDAASRLATILIDVAKGA